MKQQSKLTTGQKQELSAEAQLASTNELRFENAEELLRHDAARTPVPPEIAKRLNKSVAELPPQRKPWWRRIFGG
ncbi:MAG TPA: hypothetical protein VHZ30_00610 [Verrucomicrobiae bacterium]|jgi:hypothetical protein|nr:hypothetical protein [Verrucomicrobiae bacterium]